VTQLGTFIPLAMPLINADSIVAIRPLHSKPPSMSVIEILCQWLALRDFPQSDSPSRITLRGEWCHSNDSTTVTALNCPLCWNGCCSCEYSKSPEKCTFGGLFTIWVTSIGGAGSRWATGPVDCVLAISHESVIVQFFAIHPTRSRSAASQ
jgi:hypothetical protein